MPALRSSRRRKSSLAILAAGKPIKAGKYGVVHNNTTTAPAPRTVTFAPNVTPTTYAESGDSIRTEPADLQSQLFPPSDDAGQPSKKRLPPGKRPSQGYIPRPPNAFMLFRADFVRQKHVPGSIETNYGSLSKIVGTCWRSLPLEEKRVWEIKAKAAKAEHKAAYPDYRFKPVHRTVKEKRVKHPALAEEDQRCDDVAYLLLEGKRGEELAAAVKMLERMRSSTPSTLPRRSSSVPLPGTNFPGAGPNFSNTDNFFGAGPSRPHSPVIPELHLPRRPSSARAAMNRSWTEPFNYVPSDTPLPDVNFSLFEQSYLDGPFSAGQQDVPFSFDSMFPSQPANNGSPLSLDISPLDNIAPTDMSIPPDAFAPSTASTMSYPSSSLAPTNPFFWTGSSDGSSAGLNSDPSSIYSGSPAPSELSLPLHAPQPQRMFTDPWAPASAPAKDMQQSFGPLDPSLVGGLGDTDIDLAAYAQGLQELGISASDPMDFLGAPNAGMPDMSSPVSHFDIVGTDMGANAGMGMDLDIEALTANMDLFSAGFSVDPSVLQQQPAQPQQQEQPMASLADGVATSEPAAEPRFSFDFNDMIHDL